MEFVTPDASLEYGGDGGYRSPKMKFYRRFTEDSEIDIGLYPIRMVAMSGHFNLGKGKVGSLIKVIIGPFL